MIRHLLIIPAPGDPHGLLRKGPCGARPPTAKEVEFNDAAGIVRREWRPHGKAELVHHCPPIYAERDYDDALRHALALVWDGWVVPEGCDRAKLCLGQHDPGMVFTFNGGPYDMANVVANLVASILGGEVVVVESSP